MDNYPPGFDPKTLDGDPHYEGLLDAVIEESKVTYYVTAEVNGETVYEGKNSAGATEMAEAAETAVHKEFDKLVEVKRTKGDDL